MAETTNPPTAPVMPELFSCWRLSARLTVKACGSRFLRVRTSAPGSQDYDSACDQCPVGEHHAKHGTLCPDTQTQTPTATPAATTNTKETTNMGAPSEYTDEQKREAAKRVLIGNERREDVGKSLGVSSNSVGNWIKRWGTELASDAMDAAAGKPPKAKVAKATKAAAPAKRAAKEPSVPKAIISEEPARVRSAPTTEVARIAQELTEECKRLAPELGAAVRHIADRRVRAAVADAAWLLEELGAA